MDNWRYAAIHDVDRVMDLVNNGLDVKGMS